MNQSADIRAPNPRCLAYIATFAGILLGWLAIAAPAHSADLYYPEPYPASPYQNDSYQYYPEPYYQGAAYRPGCSPCGSSCSPCGCGRCGCTSYCGCRWRCGVTVRPRDHIIERRVVEREYYERRYAAEPRHSYRSYGYAEPEWPGYPRPSAYEESRSAFPYGYGGVRWLSPSGYYDYREPPRPPAAVVGYPGPYYGGYQ
jgi:hypothetical protein